MTWNGWKKVPALCENRALGSGSACLVANPGGIALFFLETSKNGVLRMITPSLGHVFCFSSFPGSGRKPKV